jgi:hypothetical protein
MSEIPTILFDNLIGIEDQELRMQADEDGKVFGILLDRYVPKRDNRDGRIIDICAGIMPEEDELLKHFRINRNQLVSVDIRTDRVMLGRRIGRKTLIPGDLGNKFFIQSLGEGFDLVIGRNVPLNPHNDTSRPIPYWVNIFRNLYAITKDNCKVFITLVRDDEFYIAPKLLSMAGFTKIIKAELNPKPVFSPIPGVASGPKDIFVILAEKDSIF